MKRTSRDYNNYIGAKPVQSIDLPEGNSKKRIIIAVLLLAVGLAFIGFALFSALEQEEGWRQIETTSQSKDSAATELVFLYELGVSDTSPTAEYKALSALYTELASRSYKLFHADLGFEGVNNLYYINRHIGEDIEVDAALYKAFEQIEATDSRFIFAAPFYTEYKNLFSDTEDATAALVDPYKSEEVAAYFRELSEFTSSEEHISLELLGNNRVRLSVSDEFLSYARQNGIDTFIDFYWAKNAFIVDCIADELVNQGYVYGSISSYDGFMRTLDTRDLPYSYNLLSKYEGAVYGAARFEYKGKNSIVCLRSYPVNDADEIYYTYKNGEIRHAYVDENDGLCKNSLDNMVAYSDQKGCAEVLLSMMDAYIAEEFDVGRLSDMKQNGVYSIYFDGTEMRYNGSKLAIYDLYEDDSVKFSTRPIP